MKGFLIARYPTVEQYDNPEAAGSVRLPNVPEQPATTWTTDEPMKDFEKFVQAAFDISSLLEDSK